MSSCCALSCMIKLCLFCGGMFVVLVRALVRMIQHTGLYICFWQLQSILHVFGTYSLSCCGNCVVRKVGTSLFHCLAGSCSVAVPESCVQPYLPSCCSDSEEDCAQIPEGKAAASLGCPATCFSFFAAESNTGKTIRCRMHGAVAAWRWRTAVVWKLLPRSLPLPGLVL
jgi:hypothetical protein